MDLKAAFVITCLCALAITSTEAGIPKCCIRTKNHIPTPLLRRVYKAEWQKSTGACDISALILHVRDIRRPICANPKVFGMYMQMDKRKA